MTFISIHFCVISEIYTYKVIKIPKRNSCEWPVNNSGNHYMSLISSSQKHEFQRKHVNLVNENLIGVRRVQRKTPKILKLILRYKPFQ